MDHPLFLVAATLLFIEIWQDGHEQMVWCIIKKCSGMQFKLNVLKSVYKKTETSNSIILN